MTTHLVYRGQLAYIDSMAGLIPVKVTGVDDDGAVTVRVTAERRGYRRGEVITDQVAGRNVIPRTAVFVRGGQYRISGCPVAALPDRCAADGAHHSDDRVHVYEGRPIPRNVCGFHASQL